MDRGARGVLARAPRGARARQRARFARALGGAALAAAALSAVQWLPGLEAAAESTRWAGAPGGPSAFALRPGALLSLAFSAGLADALKGDPYFWETSLHLGGGALALAAWAGSRREGRPALAAAAVLLFLAFGAARFLPLGSLFRAPARLALPACAFLSVLAAAGVDLAAARGRDAGRFLALLVVFEALAFGVLNAPADPIARELPAAWERAAAAFSPGERALFDLRTDPNSGLALGVPEPWGYGQLVPRRWAELVFASQGVPAAEAGSSLILRREHPVLRLLRVRAVLTRPAPHVRELAPTLPRLLLARAWTLARGREDALAAVLAPGFDPERTAVLEREPVPAPDPAGTGGSARVVAEDSDSLTIEAELPSPAVLVVADSYATGWRADALPGSAQASYDVLPADWALRAVPLAAGRHRFVLRYAPASFALGVLLSLLALPAVAFLGLKR
ncbi:MAG: hypothetical protein M0D55_10170 [Elusimicrobiota bacterium]|nr:MAG: hypothetical protein M0D55_10170 [Elusimicrobiota bacterium]